MRSFKANITRSKEEAIEILRGYQTQIGTDAHKFSELASVHSDCSSHVRNESVRSDFTTKLAQDKGGDLGWFGPGQMQKPFEEAAYGLKVDEISDVISTDSGVHLVMRTG